MSFAGLVERMKARKSQPVAPVIVGPVAAPVPTPVEQVPDALVGLAREHKAELLADLEAPGFLLRVWICPSCSLEVRSDLLTCPRIWCGRPRRGPVISYL